MSRSRWFCFVGDLTGIISFLFQYNTRNFGEYIDRGFIVLALVNHNLWKYTQTRRRFLSRDASSPTEQYILSYPLPISVNELTDFFDNDFFFQIFICRSSFRVK